jgi:hypothetical protein
LFKEAGLKQHKRPIRRLSGAALMAECKQKKAIQDPCKPCRFLACRFSSLPPQWRSRGRRISGEDESCLSRSERLFDMFPLFRSRLEAATMSATAGRRSLLTFFRCRKKVSLGSGVKGQTT